MILPPLVGNVERNERALAAERGHCGLGFFGVARRHHDIGTRRREPARHAEPDPAIATGDDRHTPGEVEERHWKSPRISRAGI